MLSSFHIKPYLLKRRTKKDGTIPVYIRITKNRKYSLHSTGIDIPEKDWNPDKGEIRRTNARYKALNQQLQDQIYRLQQLFVDLKPDAELSDIRDALSERSQETDFFEFAAAFFENLRIDGRYWAEKHTRVTVGFFGEYLGKQQYPIKDINHNTLEGFQRFLRDEKENNPNTIHKHFQGLKRIFVQAHRDEVIQVSPFEKFRAGKRVKSEKTRLAYDQIKAIELLQLPKGSWIEITRDAFMFSFYNAGIRFGDVARLKWGHIVDGRLKYNMAKTGTGKNIRLLKPALAIIAKYKKKKSKSGDFIFPILDREYDYSDVAFLKSQISSKNVIVNKQLKKLAEMVGIEENVSFHVSRHSFADYARTAGMNLYDISKALGHADIGITQAYLKSFDETSLDSSMEQLFGE